MKNIYLVSSFEDASNGLLSLDKELSGKTVTFIPTASKVEAITFYVDAGKKALQDLGLIIDELDVSTTPFEEIKYKLQTNDYIYITGGNTFFLMQELKKSKADQVIIEEINKGKLYIGESAGSIILSKTIDYVDKMDDKQAAPNLIDFDGLNILNFYTLPHYNDEPFKTATKDIENKFSKTLDLCPINNAQGIIIKGDNKTIITV